MKYYVYIYLNPSKPGKFEYGKFEFNYEPFYIGCGKGRRIDQHIAESKLNDRLNRKKSHKESTIFKILSIGLTPIRYKLYENISFYSSRRMEKLLILTIGRRDTMSGPLCNLTDGGDGVFGYKPSETHLYKISGENHYLYGKNVSNDIIEKIKNTIGSRIGSNNANYGKLWTEEKKNKQSIIQTNNHKHLIGENNPSKREDVRKKISESKMGSNNQNSKNWLLIKPDKSEIIIHGGIKRKLKELGMNYQQFKIIDNNSIRVNKNGWILKILKD